MRNRLPYMFGLAAAALGFQPAPPGSEGRFCPVAGLRRRGGLTDQTDQPVHCIPAILILCTESPGGYDQDALPGHPSSGQSSETPADIGGKRGGPARVKPKLDSSGNFVDILPSRSRGPDKILLDLAFINCYAICYTNHSPPSGRLSKIGLFHVSPSQNLTSANRREPLG